MENLLIAGVNTRPMVNSGLQLNYNILSASYYLTYDFKKPFYEKHILDQEKGKSCGFFENNYSKDILLDLIKEFLNDTDYIIPVSGISPNDFNNKYKKKILGNPNTTKIENKLDFYKKIKNKYLTPETFKVKDITEVDEIVKNSEGKEYIIKPIKGFGGYGINLLNNESSNELNDIENQWIIQEYIKGKNISSSVLATKNDSQTIINSKNISNESFIYEGNILPLNNELLGNSYENIIENINETSEKIINDFKLIGSNGIDYILDENNELYVLEINPRLQGTYECCETLLKINMLDAHIKACENELIEVDSNIKEYCLKKIVYSKNKMKVGNLSKIKNIYDIPYPEVIIEKNQPFVTIIQKNNNLRSLYNHLDSTCANIKKCLTKVK